MNAKDILRERSLPPICTSDGQPLTDAKAHESAKAALRDTLEQYAYGRMPPAPESIRFEQLDEEWNPCAGKVKVTYMRAHIELYGRSFSFPFFAAVPQHHKKPLPALVYIRFFEPIMGKYLPLEELTDRGYAIFSFCYQDVSSDSDDFTSGVAPYLCPDRTAPDAPGKIAMWAWAASRVMDYVQTREDIDLSHVAVIGHSRLGKTALLAGGYDERFRYVISNDSGCLGAAISRGKEGEKVQRIGEVFPFWFCPRFVALKDTPPEQLPFDQHFLLALTPPRTLLIGSAEEDSWADPVSEYCALYKTNELYALYGLRGAILPEDIPSAPFISDAQGNAAYHVRRGTHYMSREDFNVYLDYIDRQRS